MCTWYSVFHKLIIYILTLWCRSYSTFYKRTNSAYYFTDFNKVIYFLLQDVLLSVKIMFFTQFSNMCLKLFMKYLHVPILWINVRYDISLFSCHDFLDSKKRNFFSGILNPSRKQFSLLLQLWCAIYILHTYLSYIVYFLHVNVLQIDNK